MVETAPQFAPLHLPENDLSYLQVGIIGSSRLAEQLNQQCAKQNLQFTTIPQERWQQYVTAPQVDVVVEAMGGQALALDVIQTALSAGKHVITTNTAALAGHWLRLQQSAKSFGVQLRAEPAIMGMAPVLQTLASTLTHVQVQRIVGILSGPSHAILTEMQRTGASYEEARQQAQAQGQSSQQADLDVSGKQAVYQLAVLGQAAFGHIPAWRDAMPQGVTEVDPMDLPLIRQFGFTLKPIAIASPHRLRVAPMLVASDTPLGNLQAPQTGLEIMTANGPVMFTAPGGGAAVTAAAIQAELMAIQAGAPALPMPQPKVVPTAAAMPLRRFYLRLPFGIPLPPELIVEERRDDAEQNFTAWLVGARCSYGEMEQRYGGLAKALYEVVEL